MFDIFIFIYLRKLQFMFFFFSLLVYVKQIHAKIFWLVFFLKIKLIIKNLYYFLFYFFHHQKKNWNFFCNKLCLIFKNGGHNNDIIDFLLFFILWCYSMSSQEDLSIILLETM
jgi:hypothetical protein